MPMTGLELEQGREKIRARLKGLRLVAGVGSVGDGTACTTSAINLALTGELTDSDRSECMCPVVRSWVIRIQDAMPEEIRNSDEWRALIPIIAGSRSTPSVEDSRRDVVLDWMWECLASIRDHLPKVVLPAWDRMLADRTSASYAASDAANRNTVVFPRFCPSSKQCSIAAAPVGQARYPRQSTRKINNHL